METNPRPETRLLGPHRSGVPKGAQGKPLWMGNEEEHKAEQGSKAGPRDVPFISMDMLYTARSAQSSVSYRAKEFPTREALPAAPPSSTPISPANQHRESCGRPRRVSGKLRAGSQGKARQGKARSHDAPASHSHGPGWPRRATAGKGRGERGPPPPPRPPARSRGGARRRSARSPPRPLAPAALPELPARFLLPPLPRDPAVGASAGWRRGRARLVAGGAPARRRRPPARLYARRPGRDRGSRAAPADLGCGAAPRASGDPRAPPASRSPRLPRRGRRGCPPALAEPSHVRRDRVPFPEPLPRPAMAAIQALQKWCRQQCEGYRDVSITNMTTSFRDGLAFCAILHRHRPDLIDFNSLSKENVFENNQLAFRVAESELGIPALLDAEDMVALKVPDRLSILTYVSQYYNYFHGKSPIGGMAGIKRPPSETSEEPAGKKAVPKPVTPAPRQPERTVEPTWQGCSPVKQNAPVAVRRILAENGNARNSDCAVCGGHVHLVQRLLLDGKLYHRSCFRCKQCSSTLKPGNYRAGDDPGTFVCTRHEHPAQPPNSLPVAPRDVARESKPATTVPASGLYSKGLESRKPAPESVKTSQAFKSTDVTQRAVKEPSDSGDNKPHFSAASPNLRRSDPAGNKSVPRETSASPPPAPWTASAAKTQQAREKFFQAGFGTLGLPADKADPMKRHGACKPSAGTGKAAALEAPVPSTPLGHSEKDRARNILLHALPRSTPVSGGASPGASHRFLSSSSKPCAAPSGSQHPKPGKAPADPVPRPGLPSPAVEKPARGSPGALPGAKQAAQEPGTGAPAQNRARDQPFIRAPDSGQKQDAKAGKGGARATEEKVEAPSDWRARLKPVASRVATQGDAGAPQKPAEAPKAAANIDLSPAKGDKRPTHPASSPAIQDVAPSSEQPKKKKLLVPPLDISGGWQKTRQQWEDHSATQTLDVPGPPKRAVAPVRPASPRTFPKHPSGQVVSPSRLHPDYIPEEEIQKEVRQIERDLDKLELKGVDMEKHLRDCEGDDTEDALMVEWFKLIHEKQLLLRRESELMHKLNQQKLEEKQWDIESELRRLMNKSETLKSPREKAREDELLKSYLATVNDRNRIVEDLDEDRIREMEEDEMLAAMIQRLDVPRNPQESEKKKIRFSLFGLMKAKN